MQWKELVSAFGWLTKFFHSILAIFKR